MQNQSTNTIPPALAALANGRDTLPTGEAAHSISRKPQTLRRWACLGDGPIQPVRQFGRLGWPVAELAKMLAGDFADTSKSRLNDKGVTA